MDPKDLAGLKRKISVTEDPVKKQELTNMLLIAGGKLDDEKSERREDKAPEGRTASKHVTAEDSKPEAKAAKDDEDKSAAKRPEPKSESAAKDKDSAKSADANKSQAGKGKVGPDAPRFNEKSNEFDDKKPDSAKSPAKKAGEAGMKPAQAPDSK